MACYDLGMWLAACGLLMCSVANLSTPHQLPVYTGDVKGLGGLRRLADFPLRDTSVCRGPDGWWYMTGTVEPFWDYNAGIKVCRSCCSSRSAAIR